MEYKIHAEKEFAGILVKRSADALTEFMLRAEAAGAKLFFGRENPFKDSPMGFLQKAGVDKEGIIKFLAGSLTSVYIEPDDQSDEKAFEADLRHDGDWTKILIDIPEFPFHDVENGDTILGITRFQHFGILFPDDPERSTHARVNTEKIHKLGIDTNLRQNLERLCEKMKHTLNWEFDFQAYFENCAQKPCEELLPQTEEIPKIITLEKESPLKPLHLQISVMCWDNESKHFHLREIARRQILNTFEKKLRAIFS